jgi:hypothetical protein
MQVDMTVSELRLVRHLCQREIVDYGAVMNGDIQDYLRVAYRLDLKLAAHERKAHKKN